MKVDFKQLLAAGLVSEKVHGDYRIFKYKNKVFYNNLWDVDSRLTLARGIVLDNDDNVVVKPFTKSFNIGESGTYIAPDTFVRAVEKVNGFMFAITRVNEEDTLYSTTGSLDSPFVELGKKNTNFIDKNLMEFGVTYLFEICSEVDPHIIEEEFGVYLIGACSTENGQLRAESWLDLVAKFLEVKRPSHKVLRYKDLDMSVKHEGYMLRDLCTGNILAKVKTPYYLTKKAVSRMGNRSANLMFGNTEEFKKRIDEEFYGVVDFIVSSYSKESWLGLDQEQRKLIFNKYFMEAL